MNQNNRNNVRMDTKEMLEELITAQLKDIPNDKKLSFLDMKRVCKYIKTSLFDVNRCSLWTGYITNSNNTSKGAYINFYFKGKKMALHRLLYRNFVGELSDSEYLKFNCDNKGRCCNIHHLKKFRYVRTKEETKPTINKTNNKAKMNREIDSSLVVKFF